MQIIKSNYVLVGMIGLLIFFFCLADPSLAFGWAIGINGILFLVAISFVSGLSVVAVIPSIFYRVKFNVFEKVFLILILTIFFRWYFLWMAFEFTDLGNQFQQNKIVYHCLTQPNMDLCARTINFDRSAATHLDYNTKEEIREFLRKGNLRINATIKSHYFR